MELSAKVKKMMDEYGIQPEDVAYCSLVASGWLKPEAAYYAYHLAYFDRQKLTSFIEARGKAFGGISRCLGALNEQNAATEREMKELKAKIREMRRSGRRASESLPDRLTKEDLGTLYTNIIHDNLADSKTKMDAAKNYTALYQMNKIDEEVEDNRIHFFLPLTCNKCSLYKQFLESRASEHDRNDDGTEHAEDFITGRRPSDNNN